MTHLARRAGVFTAVSVATLSLLVGCTPVPAPVTSDTPTSSPEASVASAEPTASPTRPALRELSLSADGLGPLLLGQAPETDPALSMVTFDPVGCTDAVTGESFGIVAGDPFAGGWFIDPAYQLAPTPESSGRTFGVGVDESGAVNRIDLFGPEIPTDAGVRVGDDRADVLAAYPSAVLVEEGLTHIYVVSSPNGLLQMEVASRATPELDSYWGSSGIPDGRVMYIHAASAAVGVFTVAGSDNVVGGCNFL